MWSFVIPGDPIGKGRPKVTTAGKHPRTYTPPRTRKWEKVAAGIMEDQWGGKGALSEPVVMVVDAIAKRPERLCKKKHPDGEMWRIVVPDGDNVLKCVGDALQKANILADDKFVVFWLCRSLYSAKESGSEVRVWLALAKELPGGDLVGLLSSVVR